MTISDDLFLAILSMDSYNRGYDSGIGGEDGLGSLSDGTVRIGTATISGNLEDAGLETLSSELNFYAIAYDYDGQTIISYRGTNEVGLFNYGDTDFWTGWLFGTGATAGSQLELAQDFYEAITGVDPFDARTVGPGPITITGHSLGGGLAGHVASLTGDLR